MRFGSHAHSRLVQHLLQHSVRTGDFVLKSGARSRWFIDSKQTACRPEGIVALAQVALEVIPDDVTAIGGLTMGADPVAFGIAAVAATQGRDLRSFSVRKEAKGYAVGGRIAGALQAGDRVVVTEDTVTRGSSSLAAVEAVREAGATVVMVLAVVDRGGTCGQWCERAGIPFVALVTAKQLGFEYEGGELPPD